MSVRKQPQASESPCYRLGTKFTVVCVSSWWFWLMKRWLLFTNPTVCFICAMWLITLHFLALELWKCDVRTRWHFEQKEGAFYPEIHHESGWVSSPHVVTLWYCICTCTLHQLLQHLFWIYLEYFNASLWGCDPGWSYTGPPLSWVCEGGYVAAQHRYTITGTTQTDIWD